MLNIDQNFLSLFGVQFALVFTRLIGFFLGTPFFSFRALNLTIRISLAILLAVNFMPMVANNFGKDAIQEIQPFAVFTELLIGITMGFVVRLGFLAFDLLAEIISQQSGLGFANQISRDPSLISGLTGEFIGLIVLALAFVMNLHLILLELLLSSFSILPFGTWVTSWNLDAVSGILVSAFSIGLVLSFPVITVYLIFNITQAVIVRVSPQLNLFSVGFAILVPMAYVVLALILPVFPEAVDRAFSGPIGFVREIVRPR